MRITVWHNCVVVAELDLPDAPGPDIKMDPYNDLIGIEKDNIAQIPVPYHANGLAERQRMTTQSQAPACSHGFTVYGGKHPDGMLCGDVIYTVTGTYEQCEYCEAPIDVPMPAGWTVSLRNSSTGVRIMPHTAECTR